MAGGAAIASEAEPNTGVNAYGASRAVANITASELADGAGTVNTEADADASLEPIVVLCLMPVLALLRCRLLPVRCSAVITQ